MNGKVEDLPLGGNMNKHLMLAAASSVALLMGAPLAGQGVAFAQSATPPDNQSLSEVVVVARRTDENLQKVPVTVTAISADQIKATTVTTGTDLQGLVPSLSVTIGIVGGAQTYALRGINDGVVEYFNDVPASATMVDSQLFDLSSVQAVAGPQGTLFGRNTTGGNILF